MKLNLPNNISVVSKMKHVDTTSFKSVHFVQGMQTLVQETAYETYVIQNSDVTLYRYTILAVMSCRTSRERFISEILYLFNIPRCL